MVKSLHVLGKNYEEKARLQAMTVVALTEPVIAVLIGLIFLWMILSVFVPLLTLMNALA
ncbi:MAG: type II secretion system F family protein [Planctomycetaceae bacterium]|nr:type II secretion system F family protein [Planctomycetaceae bacterium]